MTQQALIFDTIESMRRYVPKLISASEKIAEDIQFHHGGWLETFLAYLDGIDWLIQAISGIQRLDQQFLENWDVTALSPLLDQMKIALEQEDFVSLCDLLQYELQPLLKSYEDYLRRLVH